MRFHVKLFISLIASVYSHLRGRSSSWTIFWSRAHLSSSHPSCFCVFTSTSCRLHCLHLRGRPSNCAIVCSYVLTSTNLPLCSYSIRSHRMYACIKKPAFAAFTPSIIPHDSTYASTSQSNYRAPHTLKSSAPFYLHRFSPTVAVRYGGKDIACTRRKSGAILRAKKAVRTAHVCPTEGIL